MESFVLPEDWAARSRGRHDLPRKAPSQAGDALFTHSQFLPHLPTFGGDQTLEESHRIAKSHQQVPLDSRGWDPGEGTTDLPLGGSEIVRSDRKGSGEGVREPGKPEAEEGARNLTFVP